jgi:hypothetical protein
LEDFDCYKVRKKVFLAKLEINDLG